MTNSTSFYITIPELAAMEARFADAPSLVSKSISAALEKAAIQTQSTVMMEVPVKTGVLRKSIRYEVNGNQAIIYVDPAIKYAGSVEHGSGVFGEKGTPIEPLNKKVMATKANPGWGSANKGGYFVIGTFQRGQEPNPFMERSAVTAKPIVMMTFAQANKLITQGLAA